MTSPYEDSLWRGLVDAHGEALAGGGPPSRPPRRPRWRRPPWRAMGGSALVIAVAVATALVYSAVTAPTPAYAVSRNADGSVAIVLRRFDGISGLNGRLQSMHVPARAVLVSAGCPPSPALMRAALHAHGRVQWVAHGKTVVRPASASARRIRILLVRRAKDGRPALGAVTARSARAVPACVNQVRVAVHGQAVRGQGVRGQAQLPPGTIVVRGTNALPGCALRPPGGIGRGSTATTGSSGTATTDSPGTVTNPGTGTATNPSTGTVTSGSTDSATTQTTVTGSAGTATTGSATTGAVAVSPAPPPARWSRVVMQCVLRATGAPTQTTGTGTATSPATTNTAQTTTTP